MLVIPDAGLVVLISRLLNPAAASPLDWQAILWSNDYTPNNITTFADLVESTVSGYSRVSLTQGEWTTPVVTSDIASSTWTANPIQWNLTGGPFNVYGWAAVEPVLNTVLLAERFSGPLVGATGPGVFSLLPQFTFRSYVPCP